MAYTFINPPFSFVQFANAAAALEKCDSLPVLNPDDLVFMFFIRFDTAEETALAMSSGIANYKLLLLENKSFVDDADLIASILVDYSTVPANLNRYRIADDMIMLTWENNLSDLSTLVSCDNCFRLGLQITIDGTTFYKASNKFQRVCSDRFTTLIEFSGKEDIYGFKYCQFDAFNRVRLPMYLGQPQLPDEESFYWKSDGDSVITKSVTRKEFEGETAHLYFETHEKIKIALSHDIVYAIGQNVDAGIRKNGNYELKWGTNKKYIKCPSEFKVYETPYLVRNDSCEDCEEYTPPAPGECAAATFTGETTLPVAYVGLLYHFEIALAGDGPFTIGNIIKPAWLTITLDGDTISFDGTPTETALDTDVTFDIVNCDGANTLAYDGVVGVQADPIFATLTFTAYESGEFVFTLGDPILSTPVVIDEAEVLGTESVDCTGFELSDSITEVNPLTIAAGTTVGTVAGVSPFTGSISAYTRLNSIHIVGKGTFAHGDNVTIGGTNVLVQINTTCTPYTP